MWIVKNESAEPLAFPELGVEVPGKEYLDLDAQGRDKAEAAESVRSAIARGVLRSVGKSEPESLEPAHAEGAGAPGILRDLADNPPLPGKLRGLLLPAAPPAGSRSEPIGVREAFRRFTQRKARRDGAEEEPAPGPEAAALRQELERFRLNLLEDIQRMLDNYLRP